jgi:hypothetical protein
MSEREKQHQFIKQLIRADTSDKCRELQARICKAERDERCIRAALNAASSRPESAKLNVTSVASARPCS